MSNLTNNGMVEPEIIPDFENEMIEDVTTPTPPKSGCGCNKNKGSNPPIQKNNTALWIGVGIVGLMIMYFMFKGGKGNATPVGGNSATVSE
jgi:hypothetical protein